MKTMIDVINPNQNGLETGRRIVPLHEITITVARSGGPGGQSVNTSESKAILRWHVGNSTIFSPEEKALIREKLNITASDELVIHCSELRNQLANKAACINRLNESVNEAIKVNAPRIPTKIPNYAKQNILNNKTRRGLTKQNRGSVNQE